MPLDDRLSRVRFDEIAVFVEVAEAGSIALAAKRLGVPKSTVGRALARVESDLGVALVRRMARGRTLTEQGRTLASLVAPHIAGLRDATMAIGRAVLEPYGTLRVTAPPDIGQTVLPSLTTAFAARYPRVRIDVDVGSRMVDLVREGYDAAIRVSGRRLPSSSLVAKRLAKLDLGLYASPAYLARRDPPRKPDDLVRHENVLFQGRSGAVTLSLEGAGGDVKVRLQGRIQANDFFFVREALLSGAGIGPIPWFVASADVQAGRLQRVLPNFRLAGTVAYFVHSPARPIARKLDVFRAFIFEHAPRLLVAPEA